MEGRSHEERRDRSHNYRSEDEQRAARFSGHFSPFLSFTPTSLMNIRHHPGPKHKRDGGDR
jgi:hypothetical protein